MGGMKNDRDLVLTSEGMTGVASTGIISNGPGHKKKSTGE